MALKRFLAAIASLKSALKDGSGSYDSNWSALLIASILCGGLL